jgi:peptidoglycan/xylan/chitin deacetylase (PgdA/CDA1 family)
MSSKGLVLMYHRIADLPSDAWGIAVRPGTFSRHLEVLRRDYEVVDLDRVAKDLYNGSMPRRWIAVTFDDGYADNLYEAKPLLERHGVPATVFGVSGKIGSASEFWWDEIEGIFLGASSLPDSLELILSDRRLSWNVGSNGDKVTPHMRRSQWRAWESGAVSKRQQVYREVHAVMVGLVAAQREDLLEQLRSWAGTSSDSRPNYRVLAPDELLELAAGGGVAIGSHSVSHIPLYLVEGEVLRTELETSKHYLEHVLNKPVTSFSYPFGSRVPATVAAVQGAGYAYACSSLSHEDVCALDANSINGVIRDGLTIGPYELPRVMIEDWEADQLSARLTRWFGD